MARGGRTPALGRSDLEALSYRIALVPVDALLAETHAMRQSYADLRRHGVNAGTAPPMASLAEFGALMGTDARGHLDTDPTGDTP